MKLFIKWTLSCLSMMGPMVVGLLFVYIICGFVAWNKNPEFWTFELRSVGAIFGVCMGIALSKLVAEREGI